MPKPSIFPAQGPLFAEQDFPEALGKPGIFMFDRSRGEPQRWPGPHTKRSRFEKKKKSASDARGWGGVVIASNFSNIQCKLLPIPRISKKSCCQNLDARSKHALFHLPSYLKLPSIPTCPRAVSPPLLFPDSSRSHRPRQPGRDDSTAGRATGSSGGRHTMRLTWWAAAALAVAGLAAVSQAQEMPACAVCPGVQARNHRPRLD